MKWLFGFVFGLVAMYFTYVLGCYIFWKLIVVHHYSDKSEKLFLARNGKIYEGGVTFIEMFWSRPMCWSKKLEWRSLSTDQLDLLIYEKCIDDNLDLLGPRSYDWMEKDEWVKN